MLRPTPEQLETLSRMEKIAFTVADRANRWPLLKRSGQAYLRTIGRSWVHHCTKNLLHVYGRENLPTTMPERGVVLVSNHRSFFDMYVIAAVLFRSTTWVKDLYFPVRSDYFYDRPDGIVVNGVMSAMAMYPPILRDPKKRRFNQFSMDVLSELGATPGSVIGMHPEGTRNKGDDPYTLLTVRPGTGQLVHDAKPVVIPMFILGLTNDFPKQVKSNFDGTGDPITLVIGAPMDLSAHHASPGNLKTYTKISRAVGAAITALGQQERAIRAREGFPDLGPKITDAGDDEKKKPRVA
jgi:1-acyl-sn-glycerol-3-phosphate acyltransferase